MTKTTKKTKRKPKHIMEDDTRMDELTTAEQVDELVAFGFTISDQPVEDGEMIMVRFAHPNISSYASEVMWFAAPRETVQALRDTIIGRVESGTFAEDVRAQALHEIAEREAEVKRCEEDRLQRAVGRAKAALRSVNVKESAGTVVVRKWGGLWEVMRYDGNAWTQADDGVKTKGAAVKLAKSQPWEQIIAERVGHNAPEVILHKKPKPTRAQLEARIAELEAKVNA